MSGSIVKNAVPRGYALGIKDETRGAFIPEVRQVPQNLPLYFILAERTIPEGQWTTNNGAAVFGAKTFDKNSPYFTHANRFAADTIGLGNQCILESVELEGAAKAMLRVSVEVIPTDITVYKRNADGSFVYQQTAGGPVKVVDRVIAGTRLVLHRGIEPYVGTAKEFKKGNIIDNYRAGSVLSGSQPLGQLTRGDGSTVFTSSRLIPIFDALLSWKGKSGDLQGMRIYTPTTQDVNGPLVTDIKTNKSFMYRFMLIEKDAANATPTPVYLKSGEVALDVSLKDGALSSRTSNPISIHKTLLKAYETKATVSTPGQKGSFGDLHVYDSNISQLLHLLTQGYTFSDANGDIEVLGEKDFDDDAMDFGRDSSLAFANPANAHLLNFFTGYDYNGINYFSFSVSDSVAFNGVSFENGANHFASGGADGLWYYADGRPAKEVNAKLFDDAVRARLNNLGNGVNKYKDALKWPMRAWVDSGFSKATKLAARNFMTFRPDVYVTVGTHACYDVGMQANPDTTSIYRDGVLTTAQTIASLVDDWGVCPQQTEAEEDAMGLALRTHYLLTPESDFYSTASVRAFIQGQSGTLIDESYDGYLPCTYEVAMQVAEFTGAGDGRWVDGKDFTINPNNIVRRMENINNTYREADSSNNRWDLGINYFESFDQTQLYSSAKQTVYPYDDSVLNSFKAMIACCYCEWLCLNVHKLLAGRDDLTNDEFIQKANEYGADLVDGKFGSGYRVKPVARITDADKEKGYVFRMRYEFYGNHMKTAMIYDVIAKNMSDYVG